MAGISGDIRSVFHWTDYLVFAIVLLLSASVGVYYGLRDRHGKNKNLEEYLMGGRKMKLVPVSMSMFVSWLSAIAFLGDPVEVYYHGAIYWIIGIGYSLACPVVAHLCAEKYHRMRLTSVYKFIEERFGKLMMIMMFFMQTVFCLLYTGIAMYAPSLALAQVCGINIWYSIVGMGFVSTFLTFLGGMKAVLWADTIQVAIMFLGTFTLLVRGCIVVGGLSAIWTIAEERGRINFNKFDPNPFIRSTFWTYLIGGFFRTFNPYIGGQLYIQRFCSLEKCKDAKWAVYLNMPLYAVFVSMFALLGLLLLAYFKDCDPLLSGRVSKADQMVPLMMVEVLGFMPGLSGLFMASLFSASLSTLSSIQNSLVTNILKDIAEPIYESYTGHKMAESVGLVCAKVFSVLVGGIFVCNSVIIMYLRDPLIFQLAIKLAGAFTGPIAGVFVLALLFSKNFIGEKSAIISCLFVTALCSWWTLGANFTYVAKASTLTVTTIGCPVENTTSPWILTTIVNDMSTSNWITEQTSTSVPLSNSEVSVSGTTYLYQFSPMLYSAMGCVFTILLTIILACIAKLIERKQKKVVLNKDHSDAVMLRTYSSDYHPMNVDKKKSIMILKMK